MKPINLILCFALWGGSHVLVVEADCSRLPYVENADVSEKSLKSNYTEGDELLFNCRVGYVSSRRITYKCVDRRWNAGRRINCSPKQCELPEDITNGHYEIVNGTEFVFGTVIKYFCDEGYMLVGRSDTRLCLSEGWSDRVPHCEVVKCVAELNNPNVIVSGQGDGGPIKYGHVLHFKCESSELTLVGEPEVVCLSNGTWSSPFPSCREEITSQITPTMRTGTGFSGYSCGPPPSIPFADITGLQKAVYKNGDRVEYQCKKQYVVQGSLIATCSYGNWHQYQQLKCLEPCVVTVEEMERRKIKPRYGVPRKFYGHQDSM
ncbi:hypothetical protein AGOR_G00144580 [Albula goreensis]|uniref:Sushi domain-containing protein n=1 Tax=Albula goreensis TaxID=1534307 RepID=A0A8T3D1K4_9TELE|nr:hypothetical protein AGOR_G00144580 [Albula goreensis]